MSESVANFVETISVETILGIFFDGKKDKYTKVLRYDESTGRFHPDTMVEEHYTITWEPEGKNLHHFTPDRPSVGDKPAQKIAQVIYEWLVQHGADVNLWMVSGDSTNTGMWGDVITFLEKLRVHRLICEIYVNELPLRRLIV